MDVGCGSRLKGKLNGFLSALLGQMPDGSVCILPEPQMYLPTLEETCGGVLDDFVSHCLVVHRALVGVDTVDVVYLGASAGGSLGQLGNW